MLDRSTKPVKFAYAGRQEIGGKYSHIFYICEDGIPTNDYISPKKMPYPCSIGNIVTIPAALDDSGYYTSSAVRLKGDGNVPDMYVLEWVALARATYQSREVAREAQKREADNIVNSSVRDLRAAYMTLPIRRRAAFLGWIMKELTK